MISVALTFHYSPSTGFCEPYSIAMPATERIASASAVPMDIIIRPDGSSQNGSVGSNDVLCGRSKEAFNHSTYSMNRLFLLEGSVQEYSHLIVYHSTTLVGNQRFRTAINNVLDAYRQATSRTERSNIVFSVHDGIRNQGGRFLKRDKNGPWMELTASQTKDKIAHAIRDAVNSSDARKQAKAEKERAGAADVVHSSKEATRPQHQKQLSSSSKSSASSSKNPFADAGGIAPKSESEQFYNKLEETTRKLRERRPSSSPSWATVQKKSEDKNTQHEQAMKGSDEDENGFVVPEPRPFSLLRQQQPPSHGMVVGSVIHHHSPFGLAFDSGRTRMDAMMNQAPASFATTIGAPQHYHTHQPFGAPEDGRISIQPSSSLGGYEDLHAPKQDLFDHAFSAGQPVNDIMALQEQDRMAMSCDKTSAVAKHHDFDKDVAMMMDPLDQEPQDTSLSESAFSKLMGMHDSESEVVSDDSFLKCINSLDLSAQDLPTTT